MRLRRRHDHDVDDQDALRDDRHDGARRRGAGDDLVDRDDADVRDELVETETLAPARWDLPAVLAAGAGAALVVIGVLALVRAGVDRTWYDPVVEVAGISHTALLGAIEVGAGALLVLAALAGARMFAALVALAGGVAAAVAAVESGAVERELAIERGWAVVLAVAGLALGLLILALGRHGERRERRVERRPVRPVRTG